jgi:hypothetical protein
LKIFNLAGTKGAQPIEIDHLNKKYIYLHKLCPKTIHAYLKERKD